MYMCICAKYTWYTYVYMRKIHICVYVQSPITHSLVDSSVPSILQALVLIRSTPFMLIQNLIVAATICPRVVKVTKNSKRFYLRFSIILNASVNSLITNRKLNLKLESFYSQVGRQVGKQVGRYVGRLVGRNEETNSSDRYWTRECQELKDEKDIYLLAGFKELSQLLFCEQKSSSKASQLKKYFLLTDSYHQI